MSGGPAWERLRVAGDRPLRVTAPRRLELPLLRIEDGDLPDVDGATAFDARRTAAGFAVWAARIDEGGVATTYDVITSHLAVRASDGALARLLGFDPDRPPPDVEWTWLERGAPAVAATDDVICPCEGIRRADVQAAIDGGSHSVDAVKRATKATFGVCQSRACAGAIAAMLGLAPEDHRAGITPRPPLVPVPASVLAVFAVEAEPAGEER